MLSDSPGEKSMRDIEFRAWDKEQKYMAYQGMPDLETLQSFIFHFGDKELSQYTGLKDKDGGKIYEGDIIKFTAADQRFVTTIKWCQKHAGFEIDEVDKLVFWETFTSEVIGNIWENPIFPGGGINENDL